MGLLDGLLGNSGGGLLDFLRQNAMNQQFAGGLQSDQAQYAPMQASMPAMARMAQPSPLDTAQWPAGPMGAPSQEAALPQNAQPTQGQLPVQQPTFGSESYLDRVAAGGGLIRSLIGGNGKQQQQQQLFEAYKGAGLTPQQAYVSVLNPQLADNFLGRTRGQQPAKVQEYLFAKQEDPTLTYAKFLQKERSTNEYGMNPLYTTNAKGETEAWQLGKDGKPVKVELPPGSTIARGIETIQTPTEVITRDKQSGVILTRERKDNAQKEVDEKVGQARGTAQAALANGADIDAEATKKKIDELMSNEGFSSIFGSLDQYRPAWTMDAAGKDARTRFEQLKGTAFLSAYAMLKGGGAITDIEGQKAGAAMARLDRSLSEDEAKQALRDFKDAVDMGLKKLRRAAGGGAEPASPAPTGGASVDDLLKKYGGK